jgi:Heterokaryon incompatibility protein (HET)
MSVVKPKQHVRYAALSYVWQQSTAAGQLQLQKGNLKEMSQPQGLKLDKLPAVIADSIALCRDIGERYLWADRLCIIQDDPESKHNQLCSMDSIYKGAAFTLVAISESPGLPGYDTRPRKSSIWRPRKTCNPDGSVFPTGSVVARHMQQSIDPSLWNQRAWTFQERILSTRCIFVTDSQVIYQCSKGEAAEELTWAIKDAPTNENELSECKVSNLKGWIKGDLGSAEVDYSASQTESLEKYYSWVKDYVSRQMTFESDILNAFAGVGNHLQQSLATQFLFGLPEKHIDRAMLWSSWSPNEPRLSTPHIPSWSWAAWKQPVEYNEDELRYPVSLVLFHYQDPDLRRGLRQLSIEHWWIQMAIPTENSQSSDEASDISLSAELKQGGWQWAGTRIKCPHGPKLPRIHNELDRVACNIAAGIPGALVFNTTVVSLTLDGDLETIAREREYGTRHFQLCVEDGTRVGWMSTAVKSLQRKYDAILLCGQLRKPEYEQRMVTLCPWGGQVDYGGSTLRVMLVERQPFESFVARRVEVGTMWAHEWHRCKPRWETVVLC